MKKLILLLLSILVVSFCGCNKKQETPDLVTQYRNYAQQCIDEGNTEKARQALEEGISKTNSAELQQMLEELNDGTNDDDKGQEPTNTESSEENTITDTDTSTTQDTSVDETTINIDDYEGWWADGDNYTSGGLVLNLYVDEDYYHVYIENSRPNGTQIADASFKVLKDTIKGNKIENVYEDSFCNYGFASIEFVENEVICTFSNVKLSQYNWGIYEGKYVLTQHIVEH